MTKDDLKNLEATLWHSADTLRANSDLKSTEYSTPVLGLIFLKFADNKYSLHEKKILKEYKKLKGTRRAKPISEIAVEKCGFYLPDHARYDYLLNLPEEEEIDQKIKKAMEAIEEYKPELKGILPQDEYFRLTRTDKTIPMQLGKEETDLFVYGQEKTLETVKLTLMNIAVNGLRGDIRQANTYYDDFFGSLGKFDYVLTNPPFNVDEVNLQRVEGDRRFNTYGVPRKKTKAKKKDKGAETVPNANYLWINLFATSLKPTGRAALVMANSASDARHSEADIRKTLIENNLIYGMLTLPSNMFYTVTLPATLWFFDRANKDDRILFIDARNIFTQIDRAHREFSEEQIQNEEESEYAHID